MKEIPLRNKHKQIIAYAFVDDDDFINLSKFTWSLNSGYAARKIHLGFENKNGKKQRITKTVLMHRQIMKVDYPTKDKTIEVDHSDGNNLNNQKYNLRICSHKDNCRNTKVSKNNTTGSTGVYFDKKSNKYYAKIKYNYKSKQLGTFNNKSDAITAYQCVASILFGEFVRII